MPAGTYYIGDLCYVIEEWHELCDIIIDGNNVKDGEFVMGERRFANYGTAYGDGSYKSNIGTTHPVDSGRIGCIKISDITKHVIHYDTLGAIVDFKDDFETGVDEGIIIFGHVEIDTAG
jgi:hypothetical protein